MTQQILREQKSESELTVEAIYDRRTNSTASPVHAGSYLDALSEAEWTNLRAEATRSRKSDNPLLCCGDCQKAVYPYESIKYRRHCRHFPGDHHDCRWAGAVGKSRRSIDAEKFRGQQEGDAHRALCRFVEEVLKLDPSARAAGISQRPYTKHGSQYAYPDVFAKCWQKEPAAFEIQLSTTQMPDIIRREDFYKNAGIRLIWIIRYHSKGPNRRAFKDIYMRNDGQILGMDDDVVASARKDGEPRFRLYRLLPGTANERFKPHWHNWIVASNEINWGLPGDGPCSNRRCYDSFLDETIETDPTLSTLRQNFYDALTDADEAPACSAWNKAADKVGGLYWKDLPPSYDTIRALGVLASLRTRRLCVPTKIQFEDHVNLINTMLLEPKERRCWTHAFKLLCKGKGWHELLLRPSIGKKCDRNENNPSPGQPIDLAAGQVFNVFFPEGAFNRVRLGSPSGVAEDEAASATASHSSHG